MSALPPIIEGSFAPAGVVVGSKIRFEEERLRYTVRACSASFAVCTKPFNPRHTVLYTVIDWRRKIRGTEDLIFCFGAESDEACQEMLKRLTDEESEVSARNFIPLYILEVKP